MSRSDVSPELKQPLSVPVSLSYRDMQLREQVGNEWRVISPPGVDRARLAEPSTWATVSDRLRQFDEVTVIASDRSSVSRWICLQAGRGYAELHCLEWHPLPAMLASVAETLPSNHRLIFDSGEGWSAVRISDGIVIERGFDSQEACLAALLSNRSLQP